MKEDCEEKMTSSAPGSPLTPSSTRALVPSSSPDASACTTATPSLTSASPSPTHASVSPSTSATASTTASKPASLSNANSSSIFKNVVASPLPATLPSSLKYENASQPAASNDEKSLPSTITHGNSSPVYTSTNENTQVKYIVTNANASRLSSFTVAKASPPTSQTDANASSVFILTQDNVSPQPTLINSSPTPSLTSSQQPSAPPNVEAQDYIIYKKRWLILILFVLYSMSNAFNWIEYSIITNIIMRYYGVGSGAVNWCSMIYMVSYIPLIFPASWYLQKKGLRAAVLVGSLGTMLGTWVKCFSVAPDRFIVTFGGQFIVAVSQIFILGIPARLAAVWFGADQVSTACAIGVFGNQLGIALGFLIPPILVPDSDNEEEISKGLYTLFISMAVICSAIFGAIVFLFSEKPPTPPSAAAESAEAEDSGSYLQGILRLVKNPGYVLLLLSYGMNVGAFYAISTLLNQVVLSHFPGETQNAGRIGLLIVVAGMLGSVVCGFILDKTSKFKMVTLVVYVLSLVFMVGYTFVFQANVLALVFVMAGALGFFMTGYLPVGFEFAAELTFPEPEGTSSGLLNASAQVFGIFCTMADGLLLDEYGDKAANFLLVAVLAVGAVMTALIKEDLRRQKARQKTTFNDGQESRL